MATPEIALIGLVIAAFAVAPADPPSAAAAGTGPGTATEAVVAAAPAAPAAPADTAGPVAVAVRGLRVESDSFTAPPALARCIAYNIQRKMPHLSIRQREDSTGADRILLVLSAPDRETFGVIRVAAEESGSHLTTWLAPGELAAAPEAVAQRLVAGC